MQRAVQWRATLCDAEKEKGRLLDVTHLLQCNVWAQKDSIVGVIREAIVATINYDIALTTFDSHNTSNPTDRIGHNDEMDCVFHFPVIAAF